MFSQQHKGVTEIEVLELDGKKTWSCKKFCGFNFCFFSWKSNLGPHKRDICGFFEMALHYVYARLLFGLLFSFPPIFFWLVCFLFPCMQDTDTKAELDHIQLWLSKADWNPKLVSLQKENERKQNLCISQALQDYLLSFHSLPNLTV